MKTIRKEPYTVEYVDTIEPEKMVQGVVYVSEQYKCTNHLCLCGCGNQTVLPIGGGRWWTMIKEKDSVSFTPSVGNFNFPCKSHYIMTNGVANFV